MTRDELIRVLDTAVETLDLFHSVVTPELLDKIDAATALARRVVASGDDVKLRDTLHKLRNSPVKLSLLNTVI